MMAAQNDNLDVLATLLELGADTEVRSIGGRSPVEAARAKGHEEAAAMIEAAQARSGS
jgi:ankyrin repeat protein